MSQMMEVSWAMIHSEKRIFLGRNGCLETDMVTGQCRCGFIGPDGRLIHPSTFSIIYILWYIQRHQLEQSKKVH